MPLSLPEFYTTPPSVRWAEAPLNSNDIAAYAEALGLQGVTTPTTINPTINQTPRSRPHPLIGIERLSVSTRNRRYKEYYALEIEEFKYFSQTGTVKGYLSLRVNNPRQLAVIGEDTPKGSLICVITPKTLVALTPRSEHLEDELKALAKRERLRFVHSSETNYALQRIAFTAFYWKFEVQPEVDDSDLMVRANNPTATTAPDSVYQTVSWSNLFTEMPF